MRLDTRKYMQQYSLTTFVETGTHIGDSVVEAMSLPYTHLYSVDTNAEDIAEARRRTLQDARVHLEVGCSDDFLRRLLPQLPGERIMFWLDAHFPLDDVQALPHDETRLPLFQELAIIKQYRAGCSDVIAIDDVHLYDEHTGGPERPTYYAKGLQAFLKEHFETTHRRAEGVPEAQIVLTPINA